MSGVGAIAGAKTPPQVTIDLQDGDYVDEATGSAAVTVTFKTDGSVHVVNSAGNFDDYDWGSGSLTPGNYEIRFDTAFGSLSSGTANTWLSLSVAQSIGVQRPTPGSKHWDGTVRIRQAASPYTELDSAAIALTASAESGA